RESDQACNRRRVHNRSTALCEHVLDLVFHTEPHTRQVDCDHLVPSFFGILCGECPVGPSDPSPRNACIIMGTIQSAIRLHRLRDQCLDGASAGDIDLDEGGFPTVFRNHVNCLLSTICVHISHNQFRPFPSKCQGCGSPNS